VNDILSPYFLIVCLVLFVILMGLLLLWRARKAAQRLPPGQPVPVGRRLVGFLKLIGFGLGAMFVIFNLLIVYVNYQEMKSEIAPVPRRVEIPDGMNLPVEEVHFSGGGGISLAGWYVPPKNGATIILLHGYGGIRSDMLWHAEALVKAGYGVLMYDERASGESGGNRRSYGWEDGPDVGGAIRFIGERSGVKSPKIGIGGCSIGGQIALQGAILYPEIAAVWADGPSNIRAADNPPPQNLLTGLVGVSNYLLDFMYERELGITAPPAMIERIHRIAPRPVMLVGGGTEIGAVGSEAPRVRNYAGYTGPNAQVWVIESATHCDGPTQQPEEYARRFVQFFDVAFSSTR
jgi:pimeloyl-ACP methyl ester carboxylesterase